MEDRKPMRRIIINIRSEEMTDELAVTRVLQVIRRGKISNSGKSYCYVTRWVNEDVLAIKARKNNRTHIFNVIDHQP